MRHTLLDTAARKALAAAVGTAFAAWSLTASPALAQDAPAAPDASATTAAGPGPATAPPPPPGTTSPSPEQAPAAPTPPGTISPDASAPAAAPVAAPPNYNIQYTGLIDGYLQYQFNNPHGTLLQSSTGGSGFANGAYNARIKTPTLALAELNVFKNPMPGGFGFKTTLIAGDVADQNHVNFNYQTGQSVGSTGEAQFKNIQQLYGTYAFAGKGGGIDVGKFYTPFGYEVTEANADYNYTRSLAYGILPFYHVGVRAYTPSYNGLVATGYVVNDIFNTATEGVHRQGDAGYIGQLNFTDPNGKFTLIGTLGFGKDLLGVKTKVTVNDDDFTYNINANQLIGLNYDYAKLDPETTGLPTSKAQGYAVYYRQALTPKTAFALRYSGVELNPGDGTTKARPKEFTVTYEMKPAANFTTRLEYRHDSTNFPSGTYLGKNDFASGLAGGSKKSQDLIILGGMFTF